MSAERAAGVDALFVTPADVSRVLGKSVRAVTGWCEGGVIEGAKKTPGKRGTWLIPEAFLRAYLPAESAITAKTEAKP